MTTAVPTSPDELLDMLGDDAKVSALLAEPEKFKATIQSYVKAVNDRDQSLRTQVTEQVQATLADFLREHGQDVSAKRPDLTPDAAHGVNRGQHYARRAPGAKVDALFGELGGDGADLHSCASWFLANTWHGARGPEAAKVQDRLHAVRNDFGSTVPADGGFLIPESLRSELLRVALESSIVRPRARVIPMDTLTVPFPTLDSTSNASNVYGGITAYWTEEGGALVESSAKFGRVKLEAKKLTAYTEVPNELFADSLVSLEAFIGQAFPEALAWFEDIAFFRGSGVGEPVGWNTAGNASRVAVAKGGSQAADTLITENILKMYARMLPTSLGRAVWIANIDTFPQLMTLAAADNSPIMLTNIANGAPMNILGRPVIFTEKAETLGDLGDLSFVDLGYYLIGDRQQIQASTSPHYRFQNDVTAMRWISRVDGRPWLQSAITPNKGSNTLSPFVSLAARA